MKHTFYKVFPIEQEIGKRYWFCDEAGLEYIRNHYTFYKKDPANVINRWGEYSVEESKQMHFDFGGMYRKGTPEVEFEIGDTKFNALVTQLDVLVEVLSAKQLRKDNVWRCRVWMHCWALGIDTINEMIPQVMQLELQTRDIATKMDEEMDKMFDGNDRVIRIKRK